MLKPCKTISGVCSRNNGEGHVKKKFLSNCRSAIQVSYVAVRQWLEILINGFLIKKVLGCRWMVVNGGGYILAGGRWWWMVVGGGIV